MQELSDPLKPKALTVRTKPLARRTLRVHDLFD